MPLTNQQLQDSLSAVTRVVNDLQTAVNNLATRKELISLLSIRQGEIDQLRLDVDNLTALVNNQ